MSYEIYKKTRNASWQCLVDCNITSLPISLSSVCRHFQIRIIQNSDLYENQLKDNERGRTVLLENGVAIIVRDTDPIKDQRYTIAHEIGHILIGDSSSEYEAERFAMGILAPACVLWGLGIHDSESISELCDISLVSARIRAERMRLLYKR